MDIHRSRFVPYPSAGINCLSFSHQGENPEVKGHPAARLAVGRANGDIELWNPLGGNWVQETIFRGGKDRSIEGLAWVEDAVTDPIRDLEPVSTKLKRAQLRPRLFSVGYSPAVTEWDLSTGLPLRHCTGYHSEAWCIASQPRLSTNSQNSRKNKQTRTGSDSTTLASAERNTQSEEPPFEPSGLAIGHADGTISLLSTADDDLSFVKVIGRPTKRKTRVLSLTFKSRNILVAGYSDSAIRVYDITSSTLVRTINFGASSTGAKELLVWSVTCLPNGTIVSGDSSGEVRLWHGSKYFQMQVLHAHNADVLGVAASKNGNAIFSTGMDRRLTIFEAKVTPEGTQRFVEASHSRLHEHDVKALATFESKQISVVVTGGLDTKLVISPLRQRLKEVHFAASGLPQTSPLVSAPKKRIVCGWWNQEVSLWEIAKPKPSSASDRPYQLLTKLNMSGNESVTDVSITPDASFLAVATVSNVRLFRLRLSQVENPSAGLRAETAVTIKKLELPPQFSELGARVIKLSGDGNWLAVARPDNAVIVLRLSKDDEASEVVGPAIVLPRLCRKAKLNKIADLESVSLGGYLRMVTRIQFSHDSRALVVSDLGGWIDSWFLDGSVDLSAPRVKILAAPKNSTRMTDSDSDDSDSDSDDEPVDHDDQTGPWRSRCQLFGQSWIQNPNASLVTHLASSPILLSFRPNNGTDNVHLFVVTAKHTLHEVDLCTGLPTDWSRRNHSANLPRSFKELRPRAIGCHWQLDGSNPLDSSIFPPPVVTRLWVWGHSWFCMFDLDRDFPLSPESKNRLGKRRPDGVAAEELGTQADASAVVATVKKLTQEEKQEKQTRNSGAGGAIHAHEFRGLDARNGIQSSTGPDLPKPAAAPKLLTDENNFNTNADRLRLMESQPQTQEPESAVTVGSTGRIPWRPAPFWRTFKYRPILGVVPLDLEKRSNQINSFERPAEVLLVERPIWDLDLPDSLNGPHDRY